MSSTIKFNGVSQGSSSSGAPSFSPPGTSAEQKMLQALAQARSSFSGGVGGTDSESPIKIPVRVPPIEMKRDEDEE